MWVRLVWTAALLAGCGGSDAGAGGGTVIIGSGQDPKSLFPPAAANIVARQIYEQLFQRLADRGTALNTLGDSGFVPRLAQRWEWSPDSLRITFHLDPRARWQDGHPVSAADVQFAFDVYTDSLVGSRERAGLLAVMDSISIGDSVTCTAWYRRRSPGQFDELVTSVIPLPVHVLGTMRRDSLATSAFSRSPIGNGQFKLVKWEQPVRLELAPSETYSGPRPALARVIWSFASDASTLFKQFTAGESDFIENLSVDDAGAAAKQPDLRVVRLGGYAYNFLTFNMFDGASDRPNALFGDLNVRRALTMLLDRPLLVRSVYDTLGRVALGPFVRVQWSADTTIAQIGFDRERGGRLLDSLGWRAGANGVRARNGHPFAFTLLVPTTSAARQRFAVLIQEQLRLAGVTVNIEKLDGQAMTDRAVKHAFDALMGGWTATPSPDGINQTWTSAAARGGGLNWGRYENPRFDAQVDSAMTARGKAGALAHYRAAYEIAVEDPPAIWLYEPPLLVAANARLRTGIMRADAWWMGIPEWSIAPGERLRAMRRLRKLRSGSFLRRFLLARSAQAAVVIAIVATLAFVLVHIAPGDPFAQNLEDPSNTASTHAQEMHRWGYDRPIAVQYVKWMGNLARGDFGWSHTRNRPVSQVMMQTIPRTLLLMGTALVTGLLAGLALGTWQAARQGTFAARASGVAAVAVLSIPEFLIALAALALPAAAWHWFPVSGIGDPALHDSMSALGRIGDTLRHLVLPAGTLALVTAAGVSRYHRAAMLAVLPEEFVRTARAKGAGEYAAVVRHALRNALGPFITILGLIVPALFGGAVFVETIFNWPGMGRMMFDAVHGNDYPLVLAGVLAGTVFVVIGNALADVLQAMADPRLQQAADPQPRVT